MRVIRKINSGGFGLIEEVEIDGERLARKLFDPRVKLDPGPREKLRQRFIREVKVQSALPPEFALSVIHRNLDCAAPWFTMPLAQEDFQAQIARDRSAGLVSPTPLADVLNCLETIHVLGLVHRDIKPANILLHEGQWKLSDFGLVQDDQEATKRLTSTKSAWGTEQYAAPEQAAGMRDVTTAVDIYAFGCILHDLAVGGTRVPYQEYSAEGPLGPIIEKCTHTDPRRRFASARAIRAPLWRALSNHHATDSPTELTWREWLEGDIPPTQDRMESFARALSGHEEEADTRSPLFTRLSEQRLIQFSETDRLTFYSIAKCFCRWASKPGFPFQYCDVLAGQLGVIFKLGDTATRAAAVVAAARMAAEHNRWYVMARVLEMAGPSLDVATAARIAIQIQIDDLYDDFGACATRLRRTVDAYHAQIRSVLVARAEQ